MFLSVVQILYEQIGFSYEYLFKSLASIEYKNFRTVHRIGEIYCRLENQEIRENIEKYVLEFGWKNFYELAQFMDSIMEPKRRYLSYDLCHTLEEFIADRFSQSIPRVNKNDSVGLLPLISLFEKIFDIAFKRAEQENRKWISLEKELKRVYPKRFRILEQQWVTNKK